MRHCVPCKDGLKKNPLPQNAGLTDVLWRYMHYHDPSWIQALGFPISRQKDESKSRSKMPVGVKEI
jgi:hypothetical protein